jgi:predicted Zn-dependent protease
MIALLLLALSVQATPDATLTAIRTSLQDSQKRLAASNPAPYFIGYSVTDVEYVQVSASNGAIESASRNRSRWLDVSVRAGSYELDNTHRVPGEANSASFTFPLRGPMNGSPTVLATALWRATDRVYKDAARRYLRVESAKDVRLQSDDNSPDFAKPLPQDVTACTAVSPASLGDDVDGQMEKWKASLRQWSELFRQDARHILNSHITLAVRSATQYVVSTDGLCNMEPSVLFRVGLLAEGKAADGMDLNRFESFEARSATGLPDTAQVAAKIAIMSADVKALENAPVLEPYSGPAILSGRAAAVFFHEALGHRVEGTRQREADSGQTFTHKVGEHILPSFISVVDDPTVTEYPQPTGNIELMGAYHFDEEGIRAERVDVADRGVLHGFLMSRTPVRGFSASNGHGRAEPGQIPVGRQGNLIVSSDKSVPRERLRKMLIDEVKKRKKPYGLLFGDVEGGYTLTHRFVAQVFQVFPLMVWRIYPDGRPDELVRGAELVGTPLVTLGKIEAAGDDPQVFNGYCGAESGYIPVSAVAPSLLISEMEVQKKARSYDRPPLLSPPDDSHASPDSHDSQDPVLSAMRDEMQRSTTELRLGDLERPYYMEYRLADVTKVEAAASLGAQTENSLQSYRPLTVGVRVGDPQLDNTNFASSAEPGVGTGANEQFTVSLDPSYPALRQDLWIASDQTYKRSLSSLAAKRAYLRTAEREDPLPDFVKAPTVSKLLPRIEMRPEAADACAAMTRDISGRLAGKSDLRDTSVRVSVESANQYYLNSEGAFFRSPRYLRTLRAWATATTPDGQRLRGGFAIVDRPHAGDPCGAADGKTFGDRLLRSYDELMSAARAPQGEEYVGPVLVEADAAAAIFATLLPPTIVGRKAVLTDNPVAMDSDRDLPSRNGRVLPPSFEVTDDPAANPLPGAGGESKALALEGTDFDDEAVAPSRVRVIEKGILKHPLSTRVPVKGAPESNGHARASAGGPALPAPTNLMVESVGGLSGIELKDRLRALCRERGLPYGLLLRRFQTAGSVEDFSPEDLTDPSMEATISGTGRGGSALQPLSLWKVYADDGHEEQVRGLLLSDLRLTALKTILASGQERATFQGFYTPPSSFMLGVLAVGLGEGLPFTLTAPAVLFDELEFRPQRRAP